MKSEGQITPQHGIQNKSLTELQIEQKDESIELILNMYSENTRTYALAAIIILSLQIST